MDPLDRRDILRELAAEGVRPKDDGGAPFEQCSHDPLTHRQGMQQRLLNVTSPGRRVEHHRLRNVGYRPLSPSDIFHLRPAHDLEFLRWNRHPVRGISAGGGRPRGENDVEHGVGRVVRRRFLGIAVAQEDVGQVLKSDQVAVAGRSIDIEGSLHRGLEQRFEIRYPPSFHHRHVGELGQRLGWQRMPSDHQEAATCPLEVRQPHHDLVRAVLWPCGVDDELRRIIGDRATDLFGEPSGGPDAGTTADGDHCSGHGGQQAGAEPDPRGTLDRSQNQPRRTGDKTSPHDRRTEVLGRLRSA